MDDTFWAAFARAVDALSPVFLAALSWLSIQIAAFINTRVKSEKVRAVLHRLDDAVLTAVREVEQVLVVSLKTASADGTLTATDRLEVKDAATNAVRAYLGAKGWLEVGAVLGLSKDELERVLAARVEAAVYDLRRHPTGALNNVLRAALSNGATKHASATNGAS